MIVQASAKLGREAQWNDWNRIGLADQPSVIIDPQAIDTTTRFFCLASNGAIEPGGGGTGPYRSSDTAEGILG